MKSGDHPIRNAPIKKAARTISGGVAQASPQRGARGARQSGKAQLTLRLGLEFKRRAYDLAVVRRCSIGRLVEDLIAACRE